LHDAVFYNEFMSLLPIEVGSYLTAKFVIQHHPEYRFVGCQTGALMEVTLSPPLYGAAFTMPFK